MISDMQTGKNKNKSSSTFIEVIILKKDLTLSKIKNVKKI